MNDKCCKSYQAPERTSLNAEELQPPDSPAVSAASRGKGRGRQGQGRRTQPSTMELEASNTTFEIGFIHLLLFL